MGYELTSFVGQVDNEFVCPICMMVVEKPLESPCQHIFCAKCIVGWVKHDSTCPVDRRVLLLEHLKATPRYYRNLWSKLKVKCHLDSMGCQSIMPLENLESHLTNCEYKPDMTVVCDKGCNLKMTRREYQKNCIAHMSTMLTDKFENELNGLKKKIEHLHGQVKRQRESMVRLVTKTSGAPPKMCFNRIHNMNLSSDEPNILEPQNTNRFCWAFVQFPKLEASDPPFRFQVLNVCDDEYIVMGLTHKNHCDELPGRRVGSIGYYSRGEVVTNGKAEFGLQKWKNGDIIECGILFENASSHAVGEIGEVYFSINQTNVVKKKMSVPVGGFYPTIRMGSFTTSVPKIEYLNF